MCKKYSARVSYLTERANFFPLLSSMSPWLHIRVKSIFFPPGYSWTCKVSVVNFQPLEVVARYRDPQPQVVEN